MLATANITADTRAQDALVPRPYQETGIRFLEQGKRRLLCDGYGLGKTLQAVYAAVPPVLIACPTYLTAQWCEALTTDYGIPARQVANCAEGPRAKRQALLNSGAEWLVCNIEMLRTYDIPASIQTFIVDEAHHLRGRTSQQHFGALCLAKRVPRVYLLTATPVMNQVVPDLFSLLQLVDPDRFKSYWKFEADYAVTVDMGFGAKVLGVLRKRKPALRMLFESYALKRVDKDVGLQLPRLVESVLPIDAPGAWRKEYDRTRKTFKLPNAHTPASSLIEVVHALRRMTAAVKLQATLELLEDLKHTRTAIFTWYKDTAYNLADLLHVPAITGDTPPAERAATAKAAHVCVANIAALSEGVDLSAFDTAIFFELDYVPGKLGQAIGRLHRSTSLHKHVRVYYPCVRRTIDDVLYATNKTRARSIQDIVRDSLVMA